MSWDNYFMGLCDAVAKNSKCLLRQVGAVIVTPDRAIVATGYNGPPRGLAHCEEVGCLRDRLGVPSGERMELCRALHAEQNAIVQAALHGINTDGSTLYCTTRPCVTCAKMLINSGVRRVVFVGDYPDELASDMLKQAGVAVGQLGGAAE